MSFEYWYMFPISTVIAMIAMASGVGGATFFTPIFLLWLKLPIEIAIGTGLITQFFGFSSGVVAYVRRRLIDYRLAMSILVVSVPMAIVGVVVAKYFNPDTLKAILGLGLLGIAFSLLRSPDRGEVESQEKAFAKDAAPEFARCLVDATGQRYYYNVGNKWMGMLLAAVGGMFTGAISTGLGALNSYFLLQRCKVPSNVAVATSVFAVAGTALTAAIGHLLGFVQSGPQTLRQVAEIVIFTIPGVIIGGQIGPLLASRVSQKTLERGLGMLFILMAIFLLAQQLV